MRIMARDHHLSRAGWLARQMSEENYVMLVLSNLWGIVGRYIISGPIEGRGSRKKEPIMIGGWVMGN